MTAPSYTNDLTDINLCEAVGSIDESSNSSWDDGRTITQESDYFIQGSYCISEILSSGVGSLIADYGSNFTFTTSDYCFMIWHYHQCPNTLAAYSSGGISMMAGSSRGDMKIWYVSGSDTYAYGGWVCIPVCVSVSADTTIGTTPTTYRYFGNSMNQTGTVSKGNPHGMDAIRAGRAEAKFEYGDLSNGYCTFTGFADKNDANDVTDGYNRWGLMQNTASGVQWQGLMSLGTASNAVDFRDANVVVTVLNPLKVSTTFNAIEINHASSNVEWESISILAQDGAVSPGTLTVADDCDVEFISCTFANMGAHTYDSNSILTACTWRGCGLVTTGAATITGCTFSNTTDSTKAVYCATPAEAALVSSSTFQSSGTGHGIEIGGTAANITLSGNIFTGYDTADPGTVANKAVYVNIATGSMTINISGGSGISEDYHVRSAGCTVTVSADTTVTFAGLKDNSEIRIYKVSDDSVVAGTEDATAGTTDNRTYAWSAPATTEVYYRIHCFEPGDEIYETIFVPSYTVPSNDTTIDVVQRRDRNAEN